MKYRIAGCDPLLWDPNPSLMEQLCRRWARITCHQIGHHIVDRSSAGPDSGNMDHYCGRCYQEWSVTLY